MLNFANGFAIFAEYNRSKQTGFRIKIFEIDQISASNTNCSCTIVFAYGLRR
jgi:hypothetical protein